MPRNSFVPKESITKIPLAVRKEIRDHYETKKEELEARVASALRLDKFSFNFNTNEICAYSTPDNPNVGYLLAGYAERFVSAIEGFVQVYGNEGIKEFNSAVPKSELTVGVDKIGDDAPTISTQIQDGIFQILFHHEKLGYNATWLAKENVVSAIDAKPREGLTLEAKQSIAEKWEPGFEDLTQAIAEILAISDLVLEPNFEENYGKLLPVKRDDRYFSRNFGPATFDYFEGLKSKLEYDKVKDDDLIQEGIQEALGKKTIKLRVVDKLKGDRYNGITFEGGVFYLETTAANWYVNVSDIGDTLLDTL